VVTGPSGWGDEAPGGVETLVADGPVEKVDGAGLPLNMAARATTTVIAMSLSSMRPQAAEIKAITPNAMRPIRAVLSLALDAQ